MNGNVGIPFIALQRGIPAVEDINFRKDVSLKISRVLTALNMKVGSAFYRALP